jgi:hypothetical protein
MHMRRKLALFFSVAVCAFALVFRANAPSLGHAEFAPLPRFDQMANAEPLAENDAAMMALRQQAHAALAGLQAAAKRP